MLIYAIKSELLTRSSNKNILLIFDGDESLMSSRDIKGFDAMVIRLKMLFTRKIPKFTNYFVKIAKKLRDSLFIPAQLGLVDIQWMGNRSESFIHPFCVKYRSSNLSVSTI